MTIKKIGFVTDSTCDIPAELIARWGIGVVPCFVNYGGSSYADDGRELNRKTFYEQLPDIRPHPTTAAPPPALAEQVIQKAAQNADHVIIITAPARLSAIHNTMRLAAESLGLQDRATLIDAGTVSIGLGWQVLVGAEVAERSDEVGQVVAAIERVRKYAQVYAGLSTMEYLRRSGRVSWAKAGVGALLQIKPVIGVYDGEVPQVALVRTFTRAVDKLVELTRAEAPLDKLAVLHANNPQGAEDLKAGLSDIAPHDTMVLSVTPVIGVHIGPVSLGVAFVSDKWKQ